MNRIINGKDTLCVLPTAFGKSLIYQALPKLTKLLIHENPMFPVCKIFFIFKACESVFIIPKEGEQKWLAHFFLSKQGELDYSKYILCFVDTHIIIITLLV